LEVEEQVVGDILNDVLQKKMMHLNFFFNFESFKFDGMILIKYNEDELLITYSYDGTIMIFDIPEFYGVFQQEKSAYGDGMFYGSPPNRLFNKKISEIYGLKTVTHLIQDDHLYLITYTVLGYIKIFRIYVPTRQKIHLKEKSQLMENFSFYEPSTD